MEFYHGTSVKNAERILKEGLLPRYDQDGLVKSNWEHSVPSAYDRVYLTNIYAPYFAMGASDYDEPWAIIELDTFHLSNDDFVPDEDYLEQRMRFEGNLPITTNGKLCPYIADVKGRTEYYRDNIQDFQELWAMSHNNLGTCAHMGAIAPKHIRRVAVFDPKKNPCVALAAMDPSISIFNYQLMRDKYYAITNWMMGRKITIDEFYGELSLPMMAQMPRKQLESIADQLRDQSAITFLKE